MAEKKRIRLNNRQKKAVIKEVKRLIDDGLVGTGSKPTAAGRVANLVYAQRGTKGLPRLFGTGCVEYYVNKMIKEGTIIFKTNEDGETYMVTKENQNNQFNNNGGNNTMATKINVVDANDAKKDEAFAHYIENKIAKSVRNTREFKNALNRALQGGYDEDVADVTGADLLKVCERWSIRKIFSLEKGEDYYKLFKEVFYIENPHKYYFEEVNPTIYRRLAPQHEEGDRKWADAVALHENIAIIDKD